MNLNFNNYRLPIRDLFKFEEIDFLPTLLRQFTLKIPPFLGPFSYFFVIHRTVLKLIIRTGLLDICMYFTEISSNSRCSLL